MSLKDQIYSFGKLDTHSAILMQRVIEDRKMRATLPDSDLMRKGDKVLKAVIEELDQMDLDLDRHIAANVRQEEYKREADHFPPELT
jgi:hypothetical protein